MSDVELHSHGQSENDASARRPQQLSDATANVTVQERQWRRP